MGRGRVENLRPWKRGQSGNPGGKLRTKPFTDELRRQLDETEPNSGRTWAALIAAALVQKAASGDVQAISEIGNRLEGRPAQALAIDINAENNLATRIEEGRRQLDMQAVRAENGESEMRRMQG